MEPENGEDHYRERLIRLPGTGICYPRPERWGTGADKAAFGFDDGPLFLCTQAPSKLLPQWDGLFKEICDRSGRLIAFFSYPITAPRLVESRLKAAGVNTLFLPFLNMVQFYDVMSLADVTLDTVGWSGGITALLALQQKRPIITLPGEFRRGRHSMAFLKAAGATGLIANSFADYVDLACNSDRRKVAMQALNPDALFDDIESVRSLEKFLLSVCRD
jgi:predicted O-linked N-acetylglucosamine transferase (SPINDLY family)